MPCTCGAEYKHLSLSELKHLRASLKDVSRILADLILDKQDQDNSWDEPGLR